MFGFFVAFLGLGFNFGYFFYRSQALNYVAGFLEHCLLMVYA